MTIDNNLIYWWTNDELARVNALRSKGAMFKWKNCMFLVVLRGLLIMMGRLTIHMFPYHHQWTIFTPFSLTVFLFVERLRYVYRVLLFLTLLRLWGTMSLWERRTTSWLLWYVLCFSWISYQSKSVQIGERLKVTQLPLTKKLKSERKVWT